MELLLGTSRGGRVEVFLTDVDADVHVPALCDVEVAAALRSLSALGVLTAERLAEALSDYVDLPVTRHGHLAVLSRVLELRDNFSVYGATYVALAERLGAGLVTADRRLRRAVASHTAVDVV